MQAYTAYKHQQFGIWSHLLKKFLMENAVSALRKIREICHGLQLRWVIIIVGKKITFFQSWLCDCFIATVRDIQ